MTAPTAAMIIPTKITIWNVVPLDDPMEDRVVVEFTIDVAQEVFDRLRRLIRVEFELDFPLGCIDQNVMFTRQRLRFRGRGFDFLFGNGHCFGWSRGATKRCNQGGEQKDRAYSSSFSHSTFLSIPPSRNPRAVFEGSTRSLPAVNAERAKRLPRCAKAYRTAAVHR